MASCGIAVMIVSVGLLCADDFDDNVWHCCDHRVIIVVGFQRDCCEITYVRLLWDCFSFAEGFLRYCCGIVIALLCEPCVLWDCCNSGFG